jgi:UDP:flavonoid glycosyltransferase YjiC (YdhE family)
VRVLCTTLPEYGHFHPMAPTARALAEAGHDVAFATAAEFCPRVERAGFAALAAGLSHDDQIDQAVVRFPEAAGLPPGQERFLAFVPRMLAAVAAPAMVADLVPLVREWRPDVIVHGEADSGGPVAAAVAGIPFAGHGVGIVRPWEAIRLAGRELAPLCERWGVDLGPLGGMFRYLYYDVCPPSIQAAHIAEVPVAHPVRTSDFDAVGGETLPGWVGALPPRPTVYVTLGTVFNRNLRLFRVILDALRDLPINLILTVGYDVDPADLGPQPDNVHVERYIPQSLLLPHCQLVVSQAGWSFVEILGHGVPMLLLPQAANNFWHADACVRAGAARRLLPGEIDAAAVAREVRVLLDQPEYGDNARRVQQEIAAMPPPADGVGLLEQLVRERRPIVRAAARPVART